MPQIFPNFVNTTPQSASPAPIQTKRVAATGNGSYSTVAVNWQVPFADTNYTVSLAVEYDGTADPLNDFLVDGFSKTASGLVVSFQAPAGVSCTINAVAFSDHA